MKRVDISTTNLQTGKSELKTIFTAPEATNEDIVAFAEASGHMVWLIARRDATPNELRRLEKQ